jgi:1,2-phenylacetyl-CoA epoxidase PaaB subunit
MRRGRIKKEGRKHKAANDVYIKAGHGIKLWRPSAIQAEKNDNLEAWPKGTSVPKTKRWRGQREQES